MPNRNTTNIPTSPEEIALTVWVVVFYLGFICCCATVGPRAMCRAILVKDPTWPDVDRWPCLHLCGWGIGGPVTARCICTVADFIVEIE